MNTKVKKTLEQLLEVDNVVGDLYAKNPKLKDGKFGYAYNRFYAKNIKPVTDEMQEKTADARIENAMVNEQTKELLKDTANPNAYKYTKEGMKKLTQDVRDIIKEFNKKEVEVIPFFTTDVPEMMDEQKELLVGCLIKE